MGPRLEPHVGRQMLGKRQPGTPKECVTGFNGEVVPGGAPGPERGRSRKSTRQGRVRSLFMYARCEGWQGLVDGGWIGCRFVELRADRSFYAAGAGWL